MLFTNERKEINCLMLRTLTCFALVGLIFTARGQVPNNQINNRYHLMLNAAPVASTTAGSSVEWLCINKALTHKCLVYHNDQWFSFQVDKDGTYYVNLSSQACQKKLGTQLILIEGNPCEVSTYNIRKCIPKLPQTDTFVRLDSLKSKVQYLLNIDGFLGDACEFMIQLSSSPVGFPMTADVKDTVRTDMSVKGKLVKLTWFVEEDKLENLSHFRVMRMTARDLRGKLVNEQPVGRNTYGTFNIRYSLVDTLPAEGRYTYKIYGKPNEGEPVLITTEYATYTKEPEKPRLQRELVLDLNFSTGSPFKVLVYDLQEPEPLYKYESTFDEQKDKHFLIDLGPFIDKGKREFMVLTSDYGAQTSQEQYFFLNSQGKLVRQ